MNQREGQVEAVGDAGGSFRAAGVRGDNHAGIGAVVRGGFAAGEVVAGLVRMKDVLPDPFYGAGFSVEVIHGDVEETLDLRGV